MVLIVIDGLDASGKSTQALILYKILKENGKKVFLRIHPSSNSFFGTLTRRSLYKIGKSAYLASAISYMLDVICSIILYSWRRYDYIIFVRYLMGTAYLPSPIHRIAYQFFASWVPRSKLMFLIDVNPQEAYRRIIRTRAKQEIFESLQELRKVRQRALALARLDNWKIIDGDKPVSEVANEIRSYL